LISNRLYKILTVASIGLAIIFVYSCSTKRNTFTRRVYHNLTAHFNVYWNGEQSLKEGVATLGKTAKDNYSKILPVFNYGTKENATAINPAMDRAIEKATLTINHHSMLFNRKEYVRWIDDAYFLMAKARFYKQDYSMARRTFDFVIKNYPQSNVKWDATLWMARTNIQMKEWEKASAFLENIQSKMDKESIPLNVQKLFPLIYAEYYLNQQKLKDAIPFLSRGIELNTNHQLVTRLKFILAQVYQQTGSEKSASQLYAQVIKRNPSYEMAFNAKINLAKTFDRSSGDSRSLMKELKKMLKDPKNKDFRDQIYYALSEIALKDKNDTLNIHYLKLSVSSSTTNTYQKATSALQLADTYFAKPDYQPSQIYYDTCMQVLPTDFPNYKLIESKANVLTNLIENLKVVQLQDSLQRLAKMSEMDRGLIVSRIIQNIIKEEERKQEEDKLRASMPALGQIQGEQGSTTKTGSWYFYNPQAISLGFSEFIKKWGRRTLEDNWRLSNKRMVIAENKPADTTSTDSTLAKSDSAKVISTDPKNPKTYLQNIPLTPEQIAASDAKIADAMYNLGFIYLDGLMDTTKSIQTFENYLQRFPNHKDRLKVYYQLYKIYTVTKNNAKAEECKNQILTGYPDSDYAKLITDPDYYLELMAVKERADARYAEAFGEFKMGHYNLAIIYCNDAIQTLLDKKLTPKFEMLKALAIGKTQNTDSLVVALRYITAKYPDSEVFPFAKNMLDHYAKPVAAVAPEQAKQQAAAAQTEKMAESLYAFKPETGHFYILLINSANVNLNVTKTKISDYNSKYNSLDNLIINSVILDNNWQMISVSNFADMKKTLDYYNGIRINDYVFSKMQPDDFRQFIISSDNYPIFYKNKDAETYLKFFNKYYIKNQKQ